MKDIQKGSAVLSIIVIVILVIIGGSVYAYINKKSSEKIILTLYVQNKEVAAVSDCGVTKKVTYSAPKTTAVADASLKILFGEELSRYGVYESVSITSEVARIMLESNNTSQGTPISSLSSCESSHLMSVLEDTLTQYDTIQSIELFSPQGKIEF